MGEANMEGELYVRARKVFVEKQISENTEKCPECETHGKAHNLRYFYISLEEAIYKCSNTQCLYPFENFIFKDLKDNSVYYYEEVGEKGENVFCKLLTNGKKDESQKALWGSQLDKTTADCDIESYNEDMDTFFEQLFAENVDPTPSTSASGQLALDSAYQPSFFEQNVVETTQQIQSTIENIPNEDYTAPANFFDFLPERTVSTPKADREAKSTPNDNQMDVVDDLLDLLGANGGSNDTPQLPVANPFYNHRPAKKSSTTKSKTPKALVVKPTKQTSTKITKSNLPAPKLTKCIEMIEKSKNKRSLKGTQKSTDIAQQVIPKPIKSQFNQPANISEDKSKIVNSWRLHTGPSRIVQQFIAGNFTNPQFISNLIANNKAHSPTKLLDVIKKTPIMVKPATIVSGQYSRQTQRSEITKPKQSWDVVLNSLSLPQFEYHASNNEQLAVDTSNDSTPTLPAEMPIVPAEIPIVPAEIPIVPAEIPIVPAENPVVLALSGRGKTKRSEGNGSHSRKRKSNADNLDGSTTENKPIIKKPRVRSSKGKKVEDTGTSLVAVKTEQKNCDDILNTIKGDHTYQIDLDAIHVPKAENEPSTSASAIATIKPRRQRKIKCEEPPSTHRKTEDIVESSKLARKSQPNRRDNTKKTVETEKSETAPEADKPATVHQENECIPAELAENSVKIEQTDSSTKIKRSTRIRINKTEKMPTIKAETTKKSRIPKNSGANKRKEPLKEKANPKPKCPTNSSTAAGFSLVGNDCDSGINGALPNVSGAGDHESAEIKEEENSFDSSISSEGIPLDGFTLADIDKASLDFGQLTDFSTPTPFEPRISIGSDTSNEYLMPTTTSAIPRAEHNANITPFGQLSPITVSDTDSCYSKPAKHKKVDISTCYQIKKFGQKVETIYNKANIMSDWNDMEDDSAVHSQESSQIEIEGDYDNIDGISLSSASSLA